MAQGDCHGSEGGVTAGDELYRIAAWGGDYDDFFFAIRHRLAVQAGDARRRVVRAGARGVGGDPARLGSSYESKRRLGAIGERGDGPAQLLDQGLPQLVRRRCIRTGWNRRGWKRHDRPRANDKGTRRQVDTVRGWRDWLRRRVTLSACPRLSHIFGGEQ